MQITIYEFDDDGNQIDRNTIEADSPSDALDALTDEPAERQTINGRPQAMAGNFLAVCAD